MIPEEMDRATCPVCGKEFAIWEPDAELESPPQAPPELPRVQLPTNFFSEKVDRKPGCAHLIRIGTWSLFLAYIAIGLLIAGLSINNAILFFIIAFAIDRITSG